MNEAFAARVGDRDMVHATALGKAIAAELPEAEVRSLLQRTGLTGREVAAAGVTGMVPAVVLLDRDGHVLRNSIQQNDARATREIEAMRDAIDPERFFRLTGGSINQQLVAPKLRWLQRHEPALFQSIATIFGSYDFIAHRLTDARYVEHNWALESGLMDFGKRRFAEELVAAAGIDIGGGEPAADGEHPALREDARVLTHFDLGPPERTREANEE